MLSRSASDVGRDPASLLCAGILGLLRAPAVGPEKVSVQGSAKSLPQLSSLLPFSLHRVAMPAFSYCSPVLLLPQHTSFWGAAEDPGLEGPWVSGAARGSGTASGYSLGGDRDMGCCQLGLAPLAWHLFNIAGCFWPMLYFGVALGNVPIHGPVSQCPPCCCPCPRGATAATAVLPMHLDRAWWEICFAVTSLG